MGSTRRTLGIIGASLVMLGFVMPLIGFFGVLNWSYLDLVTTISARFSTGVVILILGGISLAFALKHNLRPLIGTGVLVLAILVFDYVTFRSWIKNMLPAGGTTPGEEAPAQFSEIGDQFMSVIIQPAWGMFVLAAGAILLIVAGAMKDSTTISGPDWRNTPPPPMNYS